MKTTTNKNSDVLITAIWMNREITLTLDEAMAVTLAVLKHLAENTKLVEGDKA